MKRAPRSETKGRETGPRLKMARQEYTEELKAKIRRKARTMTIDGIANTLGLSITGVRYVLDEDGKRPDQRRKGEFT